MRTKPPSVIAVTRSDSKGDQSILESRIHEVLGTGNLEFKYDGAEAYLRDLSSK